MPRTLLVSVRFHDGRYHGQPEWPPSPARVFQALLAGAAQAEGGLSPVDAEALRWLEKLHPPAIVAPPARAGKAFYNYVPNNDLDAVGGDPRRIAKIKAAKLISPFLFDAGVPLLYAWEFEQGDAHAETIRAMAGRLYQLGRGIDMAWAWGDILDAAEPEQRFREHGGAKYQPCDRGEDLVLACPFPGSLTSLVERYHKAGTRFTPVKAAAPIKNGTILTKAAGQTFAQPPKPRFRRVAYNSPPTFLLLDIRKPDADAFAPQSPERVVALTKTIRDQAAARLMKGLPDRAPCIDRVFVGRDANEADKAQRIRITPLPSIGHVHAERSIRRVLIAIPPDCPIAAADNGRFPALRWFLTRRPARSPRMARRS